MEHSEQIRIAKELLSELDSKRATRDESGPWRFDLTPRMGEEVKNKEVEKILLRRPTLLGFSSLLPEPFSYRTVEIAGRSILLTRDADGVAHAFHNVCIHRGAKLVNQSCGQAEKLICPYHGWAYDTQGRLLGAPLSECFSDVERHTSTLKSISLREVSGLLFGILEPSQAHLLDQFVSELPPEFASFGLENQQPFLEQTREWKFNWKLGVDTFLENYHFNVLHRNTVAGRIIGNVSINDDYGFIRRSILARDTLAELREKDENEWDVLPRVVSTYFMYPNTIFFFFADRCETWRMDPGHDWRSCRVHYALFAPELESINEPPESERKDYFEKQAGAALKIVEIEDFPVAEGIQASMEQGQIKEVVYGQNEPNLSVFYRRLDEDLKSDR